MSHTSTSKRGIGGKPSNPGAPGLCSSRMMVIQVSWRTRDALLLDKNISCLGAVLRSVEMRFHCLGLQ